MKKLFNSKGFTLIELLVVIGILGILAASLVATIDPFEQLKKATDANVKNVLVEYVNANVRYYTTHNTFPWDLTTNGGAECNGTGNNPPNGSVAINTSPLSGCITTLVGEKELKSGFSSATNILKEIFVTYDSADNVLIGCFKPGSTSQQKELNTKYTVTGTDDTGCKSQGGTKNCYWCTR